MTQAWRWGLDHSAEALGRTYPGSKELRADFPPERRASINAFKFGGMPYDDAQASMRLFAKEVMPELRKLGADPVFDTDAPAPPAFQAA